MRQVTGKKVLKYKLILEHVTPVCRFGIPISVLMSPKGTLYALNTMSMLAPKEKLDACNYWGITGQHS